MQEDIIRTVVTEMLPLGEGLSKTDVLETVKLYVAGSTDCGSARLKIREALQSSGYQPSASEEDTLKDLYSEDRLNLTLATAKDLVNGARDFLQSNDPDVVTAFPARELHRLESRDAPRDWPARWSAAGGAFFPGKSDYPEGRMVALNDDPIWETISDFGLPFPPFAFDSGMWLRSISWSEAKDLGLIAGDEELKPAQLDLGPKTMQRLAATLGLRLSELEDEERNRRTDPLNHGTSEDLLELALNKLGLSLGWVPSKLGDNGLLEVCEEDPDSAEAMTPERLAEIRTLADKAVERGLGDSPEWLAGAHRALARIYSATGDSEREHHCQQQALAYQQEAIRIRVDFLIRRASSYDLIMAAEELLARTTEMTPEARNQILGLVERAFEQGIGEKYNLRPKAHRVLAHLYEQSSEPDKAEANRAQYFESADGAMLLKDAQDRLTALGKSMESETAAPILDLLTKAIERLPADRPNLHAEAYRATAEILEAIGEKAQAVEYYECALQMNPKIAVSKRLINLKKQLSAR